MYTLVGRSLESFLRSTYGDAFWQDLLRTALPEQASRPLLTRPSARDTRRIVFLASRRLNKPVTEIVEDLGAWIVRLEGVRRLLRFSGPNFVEFIRSLEELPGRALLVLPHFPLPELSVTAEGAEEYEILVPRRPRGWIWAIAGMLRGMADDYGTLALIAVAGDRISLRIVLEEHAAGRPFVLSAE